MNIVATKRNWDIFKEWHLITKREDLTLENIEKVNPRYIFFPHWSWFIPEEIYSRYECVVFHMTDLPFGRGGSPLQNLISRGIYNTKISALKVVKEIDAGPIYLKRDFSLYGNAEEIYLRAYYVIRDMIQEICEYKPTPIAQRGIPVVFERRTPGQSLLPPDNLGDVFDWIRMLDAEGYPKAFIQYGNLRLEFSRASLKNGKVIADVEISNEQGFDCSCPPR